MANFVGKVERTPVYLGDAVYASHDGFGVWLHLNHHANPGVVYLEPGVLLELINFAVANGVISAPLDWISSNDDVDDGYAIAIQEDAYYRRRDAIHADEDGGDCEK